MELNFKVLAKKPLIIVLISLCVCLLTLPFILGIINATPFYEQRGVIFGTDYHFQVWGKGGESAIKNALYELNILEKGVSTNLETSQVYKLNNQAEVGQRVFFTDVAFDMITKSFEASELTGKIYNPAIFPIIELYNFSPDKLPDVRETNVAELPSEESVAETFALCDLSNFTLGKENGVGYIIKETEGAKLDFGASAKGYAVDVLQKHLKDFDNVLIDLGGSIFAKGISARNQNFLIGIKHPREYGAISALSLDNYNMVTSGDYNKFYYHNNQRICHLFDGRTGNYVIGDVMSVSVISRSGFWGDVLSTSLFALGVEDGIEFLKQNNFIFEGESVAVVFITNTGKIISVCPKDDEIFDTLEVFDSKYTYEERSEKTNAIQPYV